MAEPFQGNPDAGVATHVYEPKISICLNNGQVEPPQCLLILPLPPPYQLKPHPYLPRLPEHSEI